MGGQLDPFVLRLVAEHLDDVVHERLDVELDRLQFQLPRLDLGEVEELVDEAEEDVRRSAGDLDVVLLPPVERRGAEEFEHPDHAVEWSPDLVAHAGQEGRLGLVGGVGRLFLVAEVVELLRLGDVDDGPLVTDDAPIAVADGRGRSRRSR